MIYSAFTVDWFSVCQLIELELTISFELGVGVEIGESILIFIQKLNDIF